MMTEQASSNPATSVISNPPLRYTAAYFAAFLILGITTASLGPTLPGLADQVQLPLRAVSILFIARSAGYLLGSALGGRFFDRLPGHTLLAGALLAMAVGLVVAPTLSLLALLVGVFFVIGFSEGSVDVGTNTLLIWTHRLKLGAYLNALHFFFGLGAFIAPLIIGWLISTTGGIAWGYWVLAALALPGAFWIGSLQSPQPRDVSKHLADGQVRWLLVVLSAGLLFLYVGAEAGFGGWIFSYAQVQVAWQAGQAALLTSAFWGSLTIGRVLSIPLAARLRPSTILLVDFNLCLVSLAVLGLFPATGWSLWLASLGLGFGMASIFPTTVALAERRLALSGQVTGWLFVGAGLGGMFLPWFIGQFFESVGPVFLTAALGLDLMLGLGLLLVLLRASESTHPLVEPA